MTSLLIYDEHCGWSPSLNASKGTGGSEIHLVQIATWLERAGVEVTVFCHTNHAVEAGVRYYESRESRRSSPFINRHDDTLLTVRKSSIPAWYLGARILTLVTDDPRPSPHDWDHLLGRSTLVCVSEWQASLYRAIGHTCVVIPAMIDDGIVSLHGAMQVPRRFACLSAWNKGTDATLAAWPEIRKRMPGHHLVVGATYSEPDDALDRCRAVDAIWLGRLTPQAVVAQMAGAVAHVRVCTIGETFGATDVIARALGARVHVWCPNDVGALVETVPGGVWQTRQGWLDAIQSETDPILPQHVRDYRVSTVMLQWAALLGLPPVTPEKSK